MGVLSQCWEFGQGSGRAGYWEEAGDLSWFLHQITGGTAFRSAFVAGTAHSLGHTFRAVLGSEMAWLRAWPSTLSSLAQKDRVLVRVLSFGLLAGHVRRSLHALIPLVQDNTCFGDPGGTEKEPWFWSQTASRALVGLAAAVCSSLWSCHQFLVLCNGSAEPAPRACWRAAHDEDWQAAGLQRVYGGSVAPRDGCKSGHIPTP